MYPPYGSDCRRVRSVKDFSLSMRTFTLLMLCLFQHQSGRKGLGPLADAPMVGKAAAKQ